MSTMPTFGAACPAPPAGEAATAGASVARTASKTRRDRPGTKDIRASMDEADLRGMKAGGKPGETVASLGVDDERDQEETPKERADRELIELLNELRIVLPGVTVLFAFLLAVPFAKGWPKVTPFERDVFIVAVVATGVSIAFLTAPSSFHRLRFQQGHKDQLVKIGNLLAILGIAAFAIALEAVVLLVVSYVLSRGAGIAAAAAIGGLVLTL